MVIYLYQNIQGCRDPRPPDWTWDDFLGSPEADHRQRRGSISASAFRPATSLTALLLTNGTTQLNADWTVDLNDPKVVEAITFVHDLIHVHKVSPAVESEQ
jgi:multiple sugar transport system substrate-binding protein